MPQEPASTFCSKQIEVESKRETIPLIQSKPSLGLSCLFSVSARGPLGGKLIWEENLIVDLINHIKELFVFVL